MFSPKDVILVIPGAGQSLEFGAEGNLLINNKSTYPQAKMLGSSVHSGYDGGSPLPEGLQLQPLKSTLVESMHMGYANHVFGHAPIVLPDIVYLYHGWAGYSYASMKRGSACWDKGVAQLSRIVAIAKSLGKRVIVPCWNWTGGENGHAAWSQPGVQNPEQQYTDWMLEYSKDINEVYRSITGQSELIPIIWCQTSSHSFYYQFVNNPSVCPDRPTTALVTTKLSNQYPDRFITAGAKYHLPLGSLRSVHLNSQGYEAWGRKRGQIFLHSIINQQRWRPLQPLTARFTSPTTVKVEYDVMFAPLTFDTSIVSNPGTFGFQYVADKSNGALITNASINSSSTAVILTFDKEPKGLNRSIGYAYNNADPTTYTENLASFTPPYSRACGPASGSRGCLRDSDPTTTFGQPMYNYALHSITPIR
jgi:hypothetical protein